MSRQLLVLLLTSFVLSVLAPAVAEAQFYPQFQKTSADDDDVEETLMGFPPAHPCPDPCNEMHTILRVINCGTLNPDDSCGVPNPPLTGGVVTDELPSALLLDCVRGVVVTGDGTWDPPTCDTVTNTVTVENINIQSGGTIEISFWSTIDCENGSARNEASLEWDQNPMPGTLLMARDPMGLFGTGYTFSVGETGFTSFTKDTPNITASGMPARREAAPGSRTAWIIEGGNPSCDDLTLIEMYDLTTPVACLDVDCASLRLFINDIPTPLPPGSLCPDPNPMRPAAFTLGMMTLAPGDTFRLEYDAVFTSDPIPECCNLGNFAPEGIPEVQTSDPQLDGMTMPESTCVNLVDLPEPVFNAIKDAEDEFGTPIGIIEPGQIIDWRFTLENNGGTDGVLSLTDAFPALAIANSITVPFPSGSCSLIGQDLDCSGIILNAGDSAEMVVRTTVDCNATGADRICNVGTVNGPAGAIPTHCPTCPAMAPGNETCVTVQAPTFSFATKSVTDADGNGVVDVGETITWTLDPVNTGTADGRNVVLEDTVPVGTSFVPGSLAVDGMMLSDAADADAGEVVGGLVTVRLGDVTPVSGLGIVTFDTVVDSVSGPQICNDTATLSWDNAGTCPPGGTPLPTTCIATVQAPNVSATKSVAPTGDVMRGALLTYSVEACNDPSAAAATGIRVDDLIPNGATYVNGSMTLDGGALTDAADGDGGEFVGGPPASVSVLIDDLGPGECRTVTFDVAVDGDATGSVANTASVSGDGVPAFDTNLVRNAIVVPNPAELSALKSVSPFGEVEPSTTLTYSVAVCNGPMAAMARNVAVSDEIPAGSTYAPGTIALDGAPLTDIADIDGGEFVAGPPASVQVTVGDLNPGECKTVTFDVVVDAGATGSVVNIASITSDTGPGFDTNQVDTPIGMVVVDPPRLSLTKSSNLLGMPPATVGEALEYTIVACNDVAGGQADGVVLTDLIPTDAVTGCAGSYVPSSLTLDGLLQTDMADTDPGRFEAAPAPGRIVVDIGTLTPGECVTIVFEVMIEAGCDDMETVDNVATLTATGETPLDSNATSDTVGVDPMPGDPVMLRKVGFPLMACPDPATGCGCEVAVRLDPVLDDCLMSGTCSVIDPTSWLVPGELTRSADLIFYELDGAACRPDGDLVDLRVEKSEPDDIVLRLVP